MYMVVRVSGVQYTYGVGYGVAVWIRRQYQNLRKSNEAAKAHAFIVLYYYAMASPSMI